MRYTIFRQTHLGFLSAFSACSAIRQWASNRHLTTWRCPALKHFNVSLNRWWRNSGFPTPAFGQCFKQFLDGSCKEYVKSLLSSWQFTSASLLTWHIWHWLQHKRGLVATYPATLKLQRHAMCHFHARLQWANHCARLWCCVINRFALQLEAVYVAHDLLQHFSCT